MCYKSLINNLTQGSVVTNKAFIGKIPANLLLF